MSEPAVVFRGVSFSYGGPQVLEDVSLEIAARETVCLVGPNGGGKSTWLKLALGLLTPASGRIRVLGQSPLRARPRIGYMPQQVAFDARFPITVREIVRMGRLRGGRWSWLGKVDEQIVERVLEEVAMRDEAHRLYADLSGGQRQRVLIARALAAEPEILFLDEPTAMVDAHNEGRLMARLRDLHRTLTIVLVSHDVGFVSNLVDRVFCVNRRVSVHAATDLSQGTVGELYGGHVHAVRHGSHLPGSSSDGIFPE
ncbi:MAG: metal ABC transporter ATP-binding protein [Opitutales bacterium]|nr:metal ABC transporter ATP-binding protein [Opitutales bacterium]